MVKSAARARATVDVLWKKVFKEAATLGCTAAGAVLIAVSDGSYEVHVTENPGAYDLIATFCQGGGGVVGGIAGKVRGRAVVSGKASKDLGGTLLAFMPTWRNVLLYAQHCTVWCTRIKLRMLQV
jgi:hypothetical protein